MVNEYVAKNYKIEYEILRREKEYCMFKITGVWFKDIKLTNFGFQCKWNFDLFTVGKNEEVIMKIPDTAEPNKIIHQFVYEYKVLNASEGKFNLNTVEMNVETLFV